MTFFALATLCWATMSTLLLKHPTWNIVEVDPNEKLTCAISNPFSSDLSEKKFIVDVLVVSMSSDLLELPGHLPSKYFDD